MGASQAIALAGVRSLGAVRAVLQMEYPSCIMALGIGVEDSGEREAQLGESAYASHRLQVGDVNRIASAIPRAGFRVQGSARAAERDCPPAERGSACPDWLNAGSQVRPDVVELAAEEESHIIASVELRNPRYPRRGHLQFGGPDVLRVPVLDPLGENMQQRAGPRGRTIGSVLDEQGVIQTDRRKCRTSCAQ